MSNMFSLIEEQFGGFMDIAEHKGLLYAIQNSGQYKGGRLCVFDGNLKLLCSVENIGDARQIKILNNIAVVSARSNGIFIFDVSSVCPKKLSQYQTVEFATGVTLYSDIVFVSCRQYGVEIIDISEPQKPTYIGIIRCGEVQSTCVSDSVLYCGLWGDMKVVAYDINNLNSPEKIGEYELHGRGDGVVVCDNFLYAVSGQHGKNIKNLQDESDPDFGNGNGISVFDISKNVEVFFDSFGKGYYIHIDTWKPILCGDFLICCDSVLGVHIYDATRFIKLTEINNFVDNAVTSAISCNNNLYITTEKRGIYRFNDLSFDKTYFCSTDKKLISEKDFFKSIKTEALELKQVYSGDFSVVSTASFKYGYALACGNDGLHILDDNFNFLCKVKRNCACCDVKIVDNYIIAAFSEDGICIYELKNKSLNFLSSYKANKAIQQLLLSKTGKYVACCLGSTDVIMLDISDKFNIKLLYSRKAQRGPLYGENFASNLLSDGTMLMFWHRDGVVYSNPDKGDREFKNIFYEKSSGFMCFGPENGFDTDGENMYYNLDNGIVNLPFEEVDADTLNRYNARVPICGKFVIFDNKIISVERSKGIITITDISNKENPKTVGEIYTEATCYKPLCANNRILIPSRYDGLMELIISNKK